VAFVRIVLEQAIYSMTHWYATQANSVWPSCYE